MEMKIVFSGNKKVDAHYNGFTVHTDQPEHHGGDATAPAPFDLFLASLGTCAGFYVLGFCRQRDLPTDGIELIQKMEFDSVKKMVAKITIEIHLPPQFPEKYHDALIKSASACAVRSEEHTSELQSQR